MTPPRVWLPVVTGNSGTDVWTRRLAAALQRHGAHATVSWHHRLFELAPWLLRGVRPPAGTQLVHANSWNAFAFGRAGMPLVTTDHQGSYAPGQRPLAGRARRLYYAGPVRAHVTASCRRADAVTAVSEAVADALRISVPGAEPRVLSNWIDVDVFSPASEPRAGGPFRLLFVGTPTWAKGGDLLGPVARALGDRFELLFTSGLKDRALADAPGNCRCIGRLQGESALVEAYRGADALLFPTRAEGMSLVTLEAMACGLPVVSSDIAAQRELLGAEAGLLCPPGDAPAFADACRRLLDEPGLASRLGEAARARASERFAEALVVPRYVQLYRSLLA